MKRKYGRERSREGASNDGRKGWKGRRVEGRKEGREGKKS